nr:hypothetical protein [Tanacetum cinerariifolium]
MLYADALIMTGFNVSSVSEHEDANEHIEKVLEIVDLFYIPIVIQDQIMLRAFPEIILFYNGLDVPTRQILNSKGAIPTKTDVNAKIAILEMAKYSQKWHNGTSTTRSIETFDGLAAIQVQLDNLRREIKKVNEKVYAAQRHEENSNISKEIRASTDATIRNQGASIKTLEIQIE